MVIDIEHANTGVGTPPSTRCPNCDAELTGSYCQNCGQKKPSRHDFSLRHFFGHLVHEFTHLDSNKILNTLKTLLFKPGLLTVEYLAGRKGRYINPIRLYLTFSAIYFLFAWGVLADIRGGSAERTARNPRIVALAKYKGMEPRALADKVYQKAEKFAAVLRFASVLVSGLFLSLLFYGAKRYYVENLIFSLHYYSFDFFCKSLFALAYITSAALGAKLPTLLLNFFYPLAFVYLLLALRRVYRESWLRTPVKCVVLFLLETLLFIGVNIGGFIIAFSLL
jgi:hypothetical protein